jgi:hypothetical protein
MNTTTRTAVAAAALTLAVSPLVLATPASAERVRVADVTVSTVERDVGAARQQQAYLDRLLAAARDAEGGAGQPVAPLAPAGSDDGVPISVVTLLTLGGLAVGAGATMAARRVQVPGRRPATA